MASQRISLENLRHTPGQSDLPAHTEGTQKGEAWVRRHGREAGRKNRNAHRTARDSTAIDPGARNPIIPQMPQMPPA